MVVVACVVRASAISGRGVAISAILAASACGPGAADADDGDPTTEGATSSATTTDDNGPLPSSSDGDDSTQGEVDEDSGGSIAALCDGSDSIRLAAMQLSGGKGEAPYSRLREDNGTHFIYVTGTCRFFVFGEIEGAVDRVYEGQLSQADEQQLATDFAYSAWPTAHWQRLVEDGDTSQVIFFDGLGAFQCDASCDGNPAFATTRHAFRTWVPHLQELGTPITAPVRIAYRLSDADDDALPWPLDQPIQSLDYDPRGPYERGTGALVDDLDDAAALWSLPERSGDVDDDEHGLAVVSDDAYFDYEIRDTTPLEDDRGLVLVPEPCAEDDLCLDGASCDDGWCRYGL